MERAPIFSNADLNALVDIYIDTPATWLSGGFAKLYGGEINDFDVSHITDFHSIFQDHVDFAESVANWNVSKGTNFVSTSACPC